MSWSRSFPLAVVSALALFAGCGDDGDPVSEELSQDELTQVLEQVDREVSQAFGQVFESGIEQLPPEAPVPDAVKEGLAAAAEVEREAAERLDALDPPKDAEDAVDGLARSAREQADALTDTAEREGLTAAELQQAFEQESPERFLSELEDLGYLPSNDAGEG